MRPRWEQFVTLRAAGSSDAAPKTVAELCFPRSSPCPARSRALLSKQCVSGPYFPAVVRAVISLMLLQQRHPFPGLGAASAVCQPWALLLDLPVPLPHQGPASNDETPPDSHTSLSLGLFVCLFGDQRSSAPSHVDGNPFAGPCYFSSSALMAALLVGDAQEVTTSLRVPTAWSAALPAHLPDMQGGEQRAGSLRGTLQHADAHQH